MELKFGMMVRALRVLTGTTGGCGGMRSCTIPVGAVGEVQDDGGGGVEVWFVSNPDLGDWDPGSVGLTGLKDGDLEVVVAADPAELKAGMWVRALRSIQVQAGYGCGGSVDDVVPAGVTGVVDASGGTVCVFFHGEVKDTEESENSSEEVVREVFGSIPADELRAGEVEIIPVPPTT